MKPCTDEFLDEFGPDGIAPLSPESQERIRELTMKKIEQAQPKKRHVLRKAVGSVIAAVMVMSITAGAAYYVLHDREAALMEKNPVDGQLHSVEIDEQAQQVIDKKATDYKMEAQTAGVTLDSVMGFHSQDYSAAYVTVTVTAPSEDGKLEAENCGFGWFALQPTDEQQHVAGDASYSAIDNEDGSVSVMMAFLFRYQDVTDIPMTLRLQNFHGGDVTLNETWEFDLDKLPLDALTAVEIDEALFQDSMIQPYDIQLNEFGGKITLKGYHALVNEKFRKTVQEKYGYLDLDWDTITTYDAKFNDLYEEGVITEEQLSDIYSMAPGSTEQSRDLEISLEYADGSTYDGVRALGAYPVSLILRHQGKATQETPDAASEEQQEMTSEEALAEAAWDNWEDEDNEMYPFLFSVPQDIENAAYLVIEGVKIPLQ